MVDDVNTLNGQFKDCNLKIEKVREAKLNLEKCTGNLATAAKLNITSQNGELDLGEIEEMSGTANSTKFEIQDLGNELSMTMRFGEINIRNIHFPLFTVYSPLSDVFYSTTTTPSSFTVMVMSSFT